MTAKKRTNSRTQEAIYRTFPLSEQTRALMHQKRELEELTIAKFLEQAIEAHLPGIIDELKESLSPPLDSDETRPARLPLTQSLLEALKQGSIETGLPQTRLLAACVHRVAEA